MSRLACIVLMAAMIVPVITGSNSWAEETILTGKKRVVFLGDSNTYAGTYIAFVEAVLREHHGVTGVEILNVGLSSETTSGLSEPDHPFPRPNIHERLDRVLAKMKPDLVIAGYGINDGIYYPLSAERFAKYKDGINRLVQKTTASGATIVLLTPSPFDPSPQRKQGKLRPADSDKFAWFGVYERYDDVMAKYSEWILEKQDGVKAVVDIRTPLISRVVKGRKADSSFSLSGDGVHFHVEGHQIVAAAILKTFGYAYREPSRDVLDLVTKKQKLLRDAWLTETGHKRPGIKKGMPIDEASRKANELDASIALKIRNG